MNADERDLIARLFERMSGMRGIEKDREAAALIEREAAANPDALYLLIQTVLVQEQALQAANARISELEATGAPSRAEAPEAAGFGSPRRSAGFGSSAGASVPASGARSATFGTSASVPPSGSASKPYAPATRSAANDRSAGGSSFMSQAMSTAVGVAGGMLLANGIASLLGGSSATAAPASETAATGEDSKPAEHADTSPQADQSNTGDGADLQEASADTGGGDEGWFGGLGDWGDFGGDIDL